MFCNHPAHKLLIRATNYFLDTKNTANSANTGREKDKKTDTTVKGERESESEKDAVNLLKSDMFNPIKLAVKS